MAYEDKFKSVREEGAREGTDPDPDRNENLSYSEEKVNSVPEAVQNIGGWPNRSIEQVLADMKRVLLNKPVNEQLLLSLITEAEVYSSRMVAAIEDIDDYERLKEKYEELQKKVDQEYPSSKLDKYF